MFKPEEERKKKARNNHFPRAGADTSVRANRQRDRKH